MKRGAVVTIGTFDGLHLGHRNILEQVGRAASGDAGDRVAYVFDLPPRMTLASEPPPGLLLPIALRVAMLRAAVDRVDLVRFADVRHLSPREFVERVVVAELNAQRVVVGDGFRFGQDREGDIQALRTLGEELGFAVEGISPVLSNGEPVSSTRIRCLLREGRIRESTHLLGRPPLLIGEVVAGEQIGRALGHPTANLDMDAQILLPADGIYFTHAHVEEQAGHALLYVGRRPTTQGTGRRCEVHLLSQPEEDLYGRSLEVHLLERLRDDRAFSSLDALREQIGSDVKAARSLVARYPHPSDRFSG